ncbi:MAG: hypothetical protein HY903_15920 [Deltaproteobacteria bacterium]|nr:hypothetical protein [Deltaproteobacteria bacterium]
MAEGEEPTTVSKPRSLRKAILRGSLGVGVATAIERGTSAAANILAARIAGPEVFGAYSLVLTTARTIAQYSGPGLGATGSRFGGDFRPGRPGYRRFLRSFLVISGCSMAVAAIVLLVTARPLAVRLLNQPALSGLLQVGAFVAGAAILGETLRGFFVGQESYRGVVLFTLVSGVGFLVVAPWAAAHGTAALVWGQGLVSLAACGICLAALGPLGLLSRAENGVGQGRVGPGVRELLTFGLVQLASVAGISLASWWLSVLVSRNDPTMVQMGLYSVANQFRGMIAVLPGIIAQVVYPLLAESAGEGFGGADRVTLASAWITTVVVVSTGGLMIVVLPWILTAIYGARYAGVELPTALLVATVIVQMAASPIASRLSIVSVRGYGVVNLIWTVLMIGIGTVATRSWGLEGACWTWLGCQLLAQLQCMLMLARLGRLSPDLLPVVMSGMLLAVGLAAIATFRGLSLMEPMPSVFFGVGSIAISLAVLAVVGARNGWLRRLPVRPQGVG